MYFRLILSGRKGNQIREENNFLIKNAKTMLDNISLKIK